MTMRSVLGWMSFVLALVAGRPAASEAALGCIYEILTHTHEVILYCGDQIDRQSEANYGALRADLKTFINQNARADRDKIGSEYDAQIKSQIEGVGRQYNCEHVYPGLKSSFIIYLERRPWTQFVSGSSPLVILQKDVAYELPLLACAW
jgi:hypothetical protein